MTETPAIDRVRSVDMSATMGKFFTNYAMSVLTSRALPDVRDGMKPVHRRVIYAMFDGGYRPDRSHFKCARIVGDVMSNYHPHGDTAIYDSLVRMAQEWSLRYPLIDGQGNFGTRGNLGAAASRYTEARLFPLSMEMVRDIDEEAVDFKPNYDGKNQEPVYLPSKFPNLLLNGSDGIAVGMATNIPSHNLREVNEAVQWYLANPEASDPELLEAAIARISGPDFATGAQIAAGPHIAEVYRTGRGPITMRAVVEVEEINNRTCLVITELPYQVNKDKLLEAIKDKVNAKQLDGIADLSDASSSRTGMRLIVHLKRDAVAKVVLNHLYKQTQLQTNFGVNMTALVDGKPRENLTLAELIRFWVEHQLDVIARRTTFRLHKAQERDHILMGLLKALDALDEVISTIRSSDSTEEAAEALMALLGTDEAQTRAILDMQLRRLAALEHGKILDEHNELTARIADLSDILAKPERRRQIVSEELGEITAKYGDERRTKLVAFGAGVNTDDLIPEEDMVITVTRSGYAKRTKADAYRAQGRGGKGVRGAALRADDVIEHLLVSSTHNTLLVFTNQGRVYRTKAYEIAEGARDAKGQHMANILGFQPEETIVKILSIKDFAAAPYLVLATKSGLVKKTKLTDYDTRLSGGLIAIVLREDENGVVDEVVAAGLVGQTDHLLLVSRKGQAVRFVADDATVRPMGRASAGVTGQKFREGDSLLTMLVISETQAAVDSDLGVLIVTDAGFAKRTVLSEYPIKGRAGLGVVGIKTADDRGSLAGALLVSGDEEVFAITVSGGIIRTAVDSIRPAGRATMGVKLVSLKGDDAVLAIAAGPREDEDLVEDGAEVAQDAAKSSDASDMDVSEDQE